MMVNDNDDNVVYVVGPYVVVVVVVVAKVEWFITTLTLFLHAQTDQ